MPLKSTKEWDDMVYGLGDETARPTISWGRPVRLSVPSKHFNYVRKAVDEANL